MVNGYIYVRKYQSIRSLGRPRPRCDNNIKEDRRAIVYEGVNWLQFVVVRVLLQVYVKIKKGLTFSLVIN
jgi:hypothetical protein